MKFWLWLFVFNICNLQCFIFWLWFVTHPRRWWWLNAVYYFILFFLSRFRFCTAAADRKVRLWTSDLQNNCDVKVALSSPVHSQYICYDFVGDRKFWVSSSSRNENSVINYSPSCRSKMVMEENSVNQFKWMNEWMMHLYSAFIVYCHTPKALYNHVGGGLSSTTTSVQHPLGWCDGSHSTTAPVRSPHTSYRWRGEERES